MAGYVGGPDGQRGGVVIVGGCIGVGEAIHAGGFVDDLGGGQGRAAGVGEQCGGVRVGELFELADSHGEVAGVEVAG